MTTQTKFRLCVGAVLLAAAVMQVRSFTAPPRVTLSFVRYINSGAAILGITNRVRFPLLCSGLNVELASGGLRPDADHWPLFPDGFAVIPNGSGQLIVRPHDSATVPLRPRELPTTIFVLCAPPRTSELRRRIEVLLSKVGISIASTGLVVSVDLLPLTSLPRSTP